MKKIRKAVATIGKYTDANGNEKNRYVTIGGLFKRDDNTLCMKLDSVPVGADFNGWVNFYELDDEKPQAQAQAPAPQPQAAPQQAAALDDGDLPF